MIHVRVYGVLINEAGEVLVSDEWIRGGRYTKFPGGGLEFGEGTRDCLVREFMEEMNLRIETGAHIYTTDYFQPSAFHEGHQILSIYYYVRALEPLELPSDTGPFQFSEAQLATYQEKGETESFRFIPVHRFGPESVTLPIDKIVADMIKRQPAVRF